MEEQLSSRLPEDWDHIETNVVYSDPILSENMPQGIMYCTDGLGPEGEKDIMLYKEDSEDSIGYIELKGTDSTEQREKAEEQLRRAQNHWNKLGYSFVGGYTNGNNILPWDGNQIKDELISPEEFYPSSAETIESDDPDYKLDGPDKIAEKLIGLGWDEAHENVIYGLPLDSEDVPRGLAKTNEYNTHFGQMDVCAYRDYGEGEIIGHVEKWDEDLKGIEKRLSFSRDFWIDRGFDFQGAIYDDSGRIIQRDFEEEEWMDESLN